MTTPEAVVTLGELLGLVILTPEQRAAIEMGRDALVCMYLAAPERVAEGCVQ